MNNSMRALAGALLTVVGTGMGTGCAEGPSTSAPAASVGSLTKAEETTRGQVALLVRLEAKPGKADELGRFLEGALPLVQEEAGTTTWYAIRLGPTSFGIYDSFAQEAGRQAHLAGKVAAALFAKAPQLLADAPKIERVDVLASKLTADGVRKGLVVRLEAKPGKEREVADFLRSGLAVVQAEPATKSWFAIQMGPSTFGIFDAFPDEAGRAAHLSGKIPAALMPRAGELLSQPPSIQPVDVLAAKTSSSS